jgi:hypothetical protein
MANIGINDNLGRFYLRKYGAIGISGYYESLFALEPLLRSRGFEVTTGYYLNNESDTVRLSYFIPTGKDLSEFVSDFVSQNDLEYAKPPETPMQIMISTEYGGDELRFRRFLSTYAPIGFDIMVADLLHAQRLFTTFRFQVMLPRLPYRPHFEKTFEKQSAYYRVLSDDEKEQFWKDMSYWPNPPQVDWAHMFVNMVLGCDWPINYFFEQRPAKNTSEINRLLSQNHLGFTVPENWDPSDV